MAVDHRGMACLGEEQCRQSWEAQETMFGSREMLRSVHCHCWDELGERVDGHCASEVWVRVAYRYSRASSAAYCRAETMAAFGIAWEKRQEAVAA
jgi:hypothetical protein